MSRSSLPSPPTMSFSSTGRDTVSVDNSYPVSTITHEKPAPPVRYRLYKKRFSGLLGFILLGLVTGMPWCWFGPISTDVATDFNISVDQVNWLGNVISCIYIPVSLLVPVFTSRFGIARCAQLGAFLTLISGWIRYAGTVPSLSPPSAYALLMFGQIFSAVAQPVFQVLGPIYSERWFGLRGRTTATMVIAVANPIGCALGQLLSPLVGTSRQSILVLAIISSAVVPAVFLISEAPPTPPTYAGSKPPLSLSSLCRALMGRPVPPEAHMSPRERVDFAIITTLFGILVGASNALSVLSAEWFEPVGYSDTIAGLMGACLLLSGIVASIITAPLFDRIFTHRLGNTSKILVPVVAGGWFSLIWAIRPNNTAALFAIMVIIGVCSVTMLPIGLELGVELTRNAEASAALLWCSGNLFGIILILAEAALRAPATANPPYNMENALIFHGTVVMSFAILVFFLRARQARRELDEAMARESGVPDTTNADDAVKLEAMAEEIESVKRKGSVSPVTRESESDLKSWPTDTGDRAPPYQV